MKSIKLDNYEILDNANVETSEELFYLNMSGSLLNKSNVWNLGALSYYVSAAGNKVTQFTTDMQVYTRVMSDYPGVNLLLPNTKKQREISALFPSLNIRYVSMKTFKALFNYPVSEGGIMDILNQVGFNLKPIPRLRDVRKGYHESRREGFDIPEKFNRLFGFEIENYISIATEEKRILKAYNRANSKFKTVFCEADGSLSNLYGYEFISQPMVDRIDPKFFTRFTSSENLDILNGYGIHCHFSSRLISPRQMDRRQKTLFGAIVVNILNEYTEIQRKELFGRTFGSYCTNLDNYLADNTNHTYFMVWTANTIELRIGRNTGDPAKNIAIAQNLANVFLRAEKIYSSIVKPSNN